MAEVLKDVDQCREDESEKNYILSLDLIRLTTENRKLGHEIPFKVGSTHVL